MVDEKSKDFVLSLRIPTELLKEVDQVAEKEHLNRSDYIRKAVSDAITVSQVLRNTQTFFVSPAMLQFALQFMEDLDIEKFATLSLQSGRQFLKIYLAQSKDSSILKKYLTNKRTIISGLMTYIMQSILGPTGQQWMQRIHASWQGDTIIITGMHSLGLNFSKYLYYYFLQFFEIFAYTENSELTVLKEDRFKLAFQGDAKEFDINIFMA